MTGQRFCSVDCRYEMKKAKERIVNAYFFDTTNRRKQLECLEKEGCKYVVS